MRQVARRGNHDPILGARLEFTMSDEMRRLGLCGVSAADKAPPHAFSAESR
jgi:hypothetical protein